MMETLNIVAHSTAQAEYTARLVQQAGREYLVVPVIMMVEGVHHGSGGPILHLQENFSRNPQAWNGVPLTVGHPQDSEGQYVSVQNVDLSHWVVGHLRNARADKGRLKADAWIDRQRAIAVNPEVVNYITEGHRLEVSTGASTRDVSEQGQWNGEDYHAVTLEYYPDHLALLPGEQGACSWVDGCGIRTNQKEDENEMSKLTDLEKDLKQALKKGIGIHNGLQANQTGFVEMSQRVQTMLDRRDSEAQIHFLKEIYEDYFIYEVRDRDQGSQKFFRQGYSFNEGQNEVELQGDRREVRKNVEFVEIQQNNKDEDCGCSGGGMKRTKYNNNLNSEEVDMSEDKSKQPSGEVMDKVVALINNERTRFSKTDRPWLLQLNEEQLEKLEPTEIPETEVTREQALQALSADLADTGKLVEILPEQVKAQVEAGIKAYDENRAKLIKSIQANTGDIWKAEQLENMDTDTLAGLEKSSRKTDYSGNGQPVQTNAGSDEVEMLLPGGVTLEN